MDQEAKLRIKSGRLVKRIMQEDQVRVDKILNEQNGNGHEQEAKGK